MCSHIYIYIYCDNDNTIYDNTDTGAPERRRLEPWPGAAGAPLWGTAGCSKA